MHIGLRTPFHSGKSSEFKAASPHFDEYEIDCYSTSESLSDSSSEVKFSVTMPKSTKNPKGYTHKLKTEMCKTWSLGFGCPYGNACSFAHGKAELKAKTLIPNHYKTVKCRDFHGNGFCKFGQRCQFLHLEKRKKRPTQLKKISYQNILLTFEQASTLRTDDSVERLIMRSLNLDAYCKPKLSIFAEMRGSY